MVAWVLLGFIAGCFPGRALHKMSLFSIASAAICGRLWVVARTWEDHWAIVSKTCPWTDMELLTAVLDGGTGPPRLSVQLIAAGVQAFVCAPVLGLGLGIYMCAKVALMKGEDQAKQVELDERARQVSELQSHAVSLEMARREALVKRVTGRQQGRTGRRDSRGWAPEVAGQLAADLAAAR